APASKSIRAKQSLIICPDGNLWQVPFAALQDVAGKFLIDRDDLTLAYSATGWHAATTIRKVQQASHSSATRMLVMADPDVGKLDQMGGVGEFGNTPGVAGQRPIGVPDRPIGTPDRPIGTPDRPIGTPDRNLAMDLVSPTARADAIRALPG